MSKPPQQETPAGSPTPERNRAAIVALEEELLRHDQVELELIQHFCDNCYVRELRIPAGVVLTGRIHRRPCINIVAQGEIEVATEDGRKRIKAPAVFQSPAGVKRAGLAISDTIWITVHANPDGMERDSAAMADLLTVRSFDELAPHRDEPLLED